jgi:hypothetical protein
VILGTNSVFYKGKTYEAIQATNQPDYEKKGLFFLTAKDNRCEALVSIFDSETVQAWNKKI